jgi:hypothetical protein
MDGYYTGLRCQMYQSAKILLKFLGHSPGIIFCLFLFSPNYVPFYLMLNNMAFHLQSLFVGFIWLSEETDGFSSLHLTE